MTGPHPANQAQATEASDGLNSGSGSQWTLKMMTPFRAI